MVFALSICTSITYADSGDGWGLFVDIGQLKAVNEHTGTEYQKSKVFGDQIDYQFVLGKSFSFLIFVTENMNKGSLPENKQYEYYKAGIMGAELRFWLGPLFVGVHGGQYFLTWIESLSSYTAINWSDGSGFELGLEEASGGSLGVYSENSEKIDFEHFQDQRVEGNGIIFGYLWR